MACHCLCRHIGDSTAAATVVPSPSILAQFSQTPADLIKESVEFVNMEASHLEEQRVVWELDGEVVIKIAGTAAFVGGAEEAQVGIGWPVGSACAPAQGAEGG